MPARQPDQRVLVEVRGAGEWIVGVPEGGRSLHVYRLEPGDWLVSEVGCPSEGRGSSLKSALAGLSVDVPPPDWWKVLPEVLGHDQQESMNRVTH